MTKLGWLLRSELLDASVRFYSMDGFSMKFSIKDQNYSEQGHLLVPTLHFNIDNSV